MNGEARTLRRQRSRLTAPVGAPRSGAARYGTAMHYYNLGLMSAEMLEIYRRFCKFDHEDPMTLARREGVAPGAAPLVFG